MLDTKYYLQSQVINNTDIVKKIILHYVKLSLTKGTVLDLSGYKRYSKDTELSKYIWELKMKIRFPLLSGEF